MNIQKMAMASAILLLASPMARAGVVYYTATGNPPNIVIPADGNHTSVGYTALINGAIVYANTKGLPSLTLVQACLDTAVNNKIAVQFSYNTYSGVTGSTQQKFWVKYDYFNNCWVSGTY